jgi:ribosomal protein S15P/S13E
MKRIIIFLTIFAVTLALPIRAQDVAAMDERIKQLRGHVDDLLEDKANQKKQIEALAKEIQALREHQQNQPTTAYASQEDLRKLAEKIQELDAKRKTDREVILKEIAKLGQATTGGTPPKAKPPKSQPNPTTPENPNPSNLPDKAAEHTIAAGDTLSTIAAAYSKELGVKVTTEQIRKANPGIKDDKLIVGKKILIPLPEK